MHRHAYNVGTNIVCLQHPNETLPQFLARADALLDGPENETAQPAEHPTYCNDCGGAGYVLDGAQKFQCITCQGTGFQQ